MSQSVIIKNKIVYGYMDKATVCRDMGREDYNDLTEAQQLNGDVCFIQGVDASALAPTNNIWNKLGTTPLDSELPADCSQAINQLKSNLTESKIIKIFHTITCNQTMGSSIYYGDWNLSTYVAQYGHPIAVYIAWSAQMNHTAMIQYHSGEQKLRGERGSSGNMTLCAVFCKNSQEITV